MREATSQADLRTDGSSRSASALSDSTVLIAGETVTGKELVVGAIRKHSQRSSHAYPLTSVYRFGQFVLDPAKRTLSRADSPVFLTPKAFDVLLFLAQNPNRLVTKEELLQAVWGDTFVEEGNLTQYISHLRKALGDTSEDTRLIVTIARKGYQLTADVTVAEAANTAKQAAVQASTAESSHGGTPPKIEGQVIEREPRARKPWRKAAVVGACAAILVVGYVSSRDFRDVTPAGSKKVMLAVLPFQNLTGDPNQEYLADGLTEETISQLSRLNPEQLGVIARTSVMGYKHKDVRLDQIGRDLSVQYVLENSLRESGDHLRLTAQLIQVKDQTHLWSQDYDYSAKDVLNIEDDVAKALALEIRLRLTSQQQAELARPHPVNPQAFDAYLQGYYFFERRSTAKDADMAARYFERATQLDPSYALAWAWLSRARSFQANYGLIPMEEGRRLAREGIERALSLNPNLAKAHIEMERIKQQVDHDWAGADASIQRAIALEPGNPEGLRGAAYLAAFFGRFDEALRLGHRSVDFDPLNAESWGALAEIEFCIGQLDQAAADSKKARELNPDFFFTSLTLSRIYLLQGRPQYALPEIERVHYAPDRAYLYALTYYALGRKKESDAALNELMLKYHASHAFEIATVYAFQSQTDKAFEWLDRAYAQRDPSLVATNVYPLLKSLHNDPRYAALLKKLDLPN